MSSYANVNVPESGLVVVLLPDHTYPLAVGLRILPLSPSVELAFSYFHKAFQDVCNKHDPFKQCLVKGRENPWFSVDLAKIIRKWNTVWAKARRSDSADDWMAFVLLVLKGGVPIL